jgi:hypothetical protein
VSAKRRIDAIRLFLVFSILLLLGRIIERLRPLIASLPRSFGPA